MPKSIKQKITIDHIHKHLLNISETLYLIKTNQEDTLAKIGSLLTHILTNQKNMGKELDDLTAAVAKDTEVDASAITLLQGLKAALDSAGTDPVALKALSDQLGANAQALADAVVANTPAAA